MVTSTIYRLSGISLLIGGLLAALGVVGQAFFPDLSSPVWSLVSASTYIGLLFVLSGLPALYAWQMKRAGKLGLIAFILFFLACAQFGGSSGVFDIVALPWLTQANAFNNLPMSFILFFLIAKIFLLVGSLVFGIAALRSGTLPKGSIILLIVGAILFILGGKVRAIPYLDSFGEMLFCLSFVWFSSVLLSRQEVEARPAPAASGTNARA
ncbi:MAG TPA: hypothetical protein VGT82_05765 [Ktedonobacteraceae bacterium]|nr:hypothetical protein [Ktedonobacteraceae bacterium]